MKVLRAGVVGLGLMGRHHTRVLGEMADVDLVAVVDPAGDRLGAARDVPVLADVEQLLALEVDLCVVATPTIEHAAVATALADAGVACLIEKPLADTVESGAALVEQFAVRGLVGAVGHIERCNPAIRALNARLGQGELGDLYQVTTSRQGPFPDHVRDVGVVKDLATHDIDATAYATGHKFASVAARAAYRTGRVHEDLVAIVGQLDDGTVTNHLVNWLTPTKERRFVVTGERGCFVADTMSGDLTWYANASIPAASERVPGFPGVSEGDMVRFAIPKPEPVLVQMQAFIASVRAGAPVAGVVRLEEGLDALRVADAVLRSAADGVVVELAG
jgi:predicted dehydrogenase